MGRGGVSSTQDGRLTVRKLDRLRAAIARPDLSDGDRTGLLFSPGKGMGDMESMLLVEAYAHGNRLKTASRLMTPRSRRFVQEAKRWFERFLRQSAGRTSGK